jgi:hypothetical protein
MRLGVIGPSNGDLVALATAAQVLVDHSQVERVLYLGKDDALDRVVQAWATEIVGANPDEAVLFARAAVACVKASAKDIDAFVASERVRRRLRIYATVPAPPGRTVELFDGRIAVFVYDKATLDEDDIAGASVMVFGRSDRPLVHRVGSRTFVAPGSLGSPGGGHRGARRRVGARNSHRVPRLRRGRSSPLSASRAARHAPAGKLKVQGSGS